MTGVIKQKTARGVSIWQALADRLGRQPSNSEVKAELARITEESLIERAELGKLKHQRR